MNFVLDEYLDRSRERIERFMEGWMPGGPGLPHELCDAMRYSFFAGGKRLRPALVYGGVDALDGDPRKATPFAVGLEMIHTYSLIHDDLPAMDDDGMRRGKPTSHVVYGEAMAILAGDGLLTDSFALMSSPETIAAVGADLALRCLCEIARAAGSCGMVGGQALDIDSEGKTLDLEGLNEIHTRKTGRLIRASVVVGGLLGNGTDEDIDKLSAYAERIGLAFQIADDVLDVEGDTKTLGKPVGSDQGLDKATYPALMGVEEARKKACSLVDEAVELLADYGDGGEPLRTIARFIVARKY